MRTVPGYLGLTEDEDLACVADPDSRKYFIKQDPPAPCTGPQGTAQCAQLSEAEVFETVIIPEIPARQAKDFYDPFRLEEPGCSAKN